MATLILGAAGAGLGAVLGGPLGGTIGRAAGGVAGALVDQRLLGGGGRAVETAPAPGLRVQSGREGAPIPRVHGRIRVTGHVIWASEYRETFGRSVGGKAGGLGARPVLQTRRRSVSLALALCEGPIDRLGRVWANGRPLARDAVELRLHRGDEDQPPDPLILGLEGAAPAFRGTAYVVLEELDLTPFGGRIPQLAFEVFRHPRIVGGSAEIGRPLSDMVRGVALSPGSGEFSLETRPVRRRLGPGAAASENVHGPDGRADLLAALDQLQEEAPACGSVLLLSTWFGDDLRCGTCRIEPRVETRDKRTEPVSWRVGGMGRDGARPVGMRDGRPVFGGTPSDGGVIAAIRELRARGLRPVFYPFLMMDVPPGSGLPDPWGGAEQAPYPWRGRITSEIAPGRPGSPEGSAAVAAEMAAFFGAAQPGDFTPDGDSVVYRGPAEWSFRRFVLHYAHLCALAGGVGAFCIGSEMRGLTTLRAGPGSYPAVDAMRQLARDVRAVLGPEARIGYAADWSEYFGHQPADGSGDAVFHLDPLWADPAIDFVGIDNYMPIADWRGEPGEADAAEGGPHRLAYLRKGVAGGEGWEWYYASPEDRQAQRRSPIADGAHGEPWVFRYKDIASWWARPHHDRIGGVRAATPTAWAPCSKPIWFTELGCPAVDNGANQPNLFVDPKSSETGLPHFSAGVRDDAAQRRFLQAVLEHWNDPSNNPVSPVYGGPMVDPAAVHVWTWDARPWPEFPGRTDVWADGENHRLGHWINGRMAAPGLAEVVAAICAEAGVAVDVDGLHGVVPGYLVEATQTARQSLQPLMLAYGFDMVESGPGMRAVMRTALPVGGLSAADCVQGDGAEGALEVLRGPGVGEASALRFAYLDGEADYAPAVAELRPGGSAETARVETALALGTELARILAQRMAAELAQPPGTARFRLPPSRFDLEPGDVVEVSGCAGRGIFRVDRIVDAMAREVEASAVAAAPRPAAATVGRAPLKTAPLRHPPIAAVVEAPEPWGAGDRALLHVAAFAEPWPGPLGVWREERPGEGWRLQGAIEAPATMGVVVADGPAWARDRWGMGPEVRLWGGSLPSASRGAVLDGANIAAVEGPLGWEALQYSDATLIGPDHWRLGGALRGLGATGGGKAAVGARFVLLDGAALRIAVPPGAVGLRYRLRIGALALGHDDEACTEVETVTTGAGARPLPPTALRFARNGYSLTLRWIARGRADLDGWHGLDGAGAPAQWRVRVRAGGEILRVETATECRFEYAAAAQVADGAVAPFEISVAQVSDTWGEGPERGAMWYG